MKNVIIEAGKRLGEYLREELDGRVTLANAKRLCAVATDVLPGERYEQARGLLTLCQKHHLLEKYSESNFDRDTRVKEIVHILVDRGMLAKSFALNAAALVVIICEGSAEAEEFANTLLEEQTEGQNSDTVTPVPPKQQTQNQTTPKEQSTQPQIPTQPQKPNNPSDFYIVDGVLKAYRGRDAHVVVPSNVKAIAGKAFENCSFLKSVVVPNSVKSIGSGAFSGCSSLESISIPFVGGSARKPFETFRKPFGFIFGTTSYDGGEYTKQSYYGYDSVYYIPNSLKHVTVTGGYMLEGAFYNCSNLVSVTFLPEKADILPRHIFFGCTSLQTFNLPDGIRTFGIGAFCFCDSLDNIVIPEGVDFIGLSAFANCTNLKSVTIPKSVKVIEKDAFKNCPNLTIYKVGGLGIFETLFGTKWNPNRRPVKKI